MPKPYPIIYLPNAKDQETLVRALWRMGWRFGFLSGSYDMTEDATWESWDGPSTKTHVYTYLTARWKMSAATRRLPECTLVNSIPHFLSYTRSLGAPSAPPPQS